MTGRVKKAEAANPSTGKIEIKKSVCTHCAVGCIKICGLCAIEIAEKMRGPGANVLFKEIFLLGQGRVRAKVAKNEPGHHVVNGGDMIFRVRGIRIGLDIKPAHRIAQFCQRFFV